MRLSLHSYWGVMLVIAISGGTLFAHDDNDGKGINGSAGANYGFGTNSFTDGYDSKNINLLSHLYLNEIGNSHGPEYAIRLPPLLIHRYEKTTLRRFGSTKF